MRDDAVLGRALPLDRGLGPMTCKELYVPVIYAVFRKKTATFVFLDQFE